MLKLIDSIAWGWSASRWISCTSSHATGERCFGAAACHGKDSEKISRVGSMTLVRGMVTGPRFARFCALLGLIALAGYPACDFGEDPKTAGGKSLTSGDSGPEASSGRGGSDQGGAGGQGGSGKGGAAAGGADARVADGSVEETGSDSSQETGSDSAEETGSDSADDRGLAEAGAISIIQITYSPGLGGSTYFGLLSDDARFVAFSTSMADLVPDDTNGKTDGFLRDLQTGATVRVTVRADGSQTIGDNKVIGMSANGQYTGFSSDQPIVTPDPNGSGWDCFVRDGASGRIEQVNILNGTGLAPGECKGPVSMSISADGRYVMFPWTGVVAPWWAIVVRDRLTAISEVVSVSSTDQIASGPVYGALMSSDGRYIVFASPVTNLDPSVSYSDDQTFIRDRVARTTRLVSRGLTGGPNGKTELTPDVSDDGRFVAFSSGSSNLTTGDTNGKWDVFVRDMRDGVTTRVSVSSSGAEGDDTSVGNAISADGRYVAFQSYATNLVSGDSNGKADVFVHDRLTRTTIRVSVNAAGVEANDHSSPDAVTANRRVLFASSASNLVTTELESGDLFLVTF